MGRRQARRCLLDFTTYTYPQYRAEPAHALIAAHLDAVVRGEINRLMIFAPPQHGKTELASVRLPAFWLGKRPEDPVILASYAADLAQSKSRQARQAVESSEYAMLFPGITTQGDSRAVNHWQIAGKRGGMLAVGVGGGVTGHGAMLGIIDDPVENWEQAQSAVIREKTWEWYRTTFRTRIWETGAIVLIMCMTGDTPILMADGGERPLRDVKVGDRVATYDKGKLGTSTVQNHRSNGLDSVFAVKTTCGKVVYANERHPFLVEEHGQLRWIRLKTLTTAHRIVTVRDNGANGKGRPAALRDARSLLDAGDIACRTTARRCGRMGIVPRQSMRSTDARHVSSIGTESLPLSTMRCSQRKTVNAPFANSHLAITCVRIGAASYVLTTATQRTPSEGFCATTATLPRDTPRQRLSHSPSLNTSDFTTAQLESIEPAGVEEVFDIQIARTGNFIANGLVSHNTRWHADDLAGRLLQANSNEWTALRLPAIAETQDDRDENNKRLGLPLGEADPLGREPGEALCPGRFSLAELERLRLDIGSMAWASEYQGTPRAAEGNRFKRSWFAIVEAAPKEARRVRYWDKAGTAGGGARTAGILVAYANGIAYVEDVVKGQWSSGERNKVMLQTTQLDAARYANTVHIWTEQEPGSGGKESAEATIKLLAGHSVRAEAVTGSKEVRAEPFAAQAEAGNVKLVKGAWNYDYLEELCSFPNGSFKDQVDASSGAFNKLARGGVHFG